MQETVRSSKRFIASLSQRVRQVLYFAVTYLLLLSICLLAISPEQYDLGVGDVAAFEKFSLATDII